MGKALGLAPPPNRSALVLDTETEELPARPKTSPCPRRPDPDFRLEPELFSLRKKDRVGMLLGCVSESDRAPLKLQELLAVKASSNARKSATKTIHTQQVHFEAERVD